MFCFVLRFALWPLFIALAFGTFQFGTLIEGSNPFKKMLFILVLYSKIYVAWLASINFSASYRGSTNLLNDRETQSTLFALHCTCGWDNLISLVTSPFGCHGSIVKLFLQVFFGPCVLFIAYLKVPSFIENGYSLQIIKQWVSDQLHGLCIGWKFVQKLPLRFLPSALIPGGTTRPPLPSCHLGSFLSSTVPSLSLPSSSTNLPSNPVQLVKTTTIQPGKTTSTVPSNSQLGRPDSAAKQWFSTTNCMKTSLQTVANPVASR